MSNYEIYYNTENLRTFELGYLYALKKLETNNNGIQVARAVGYFRTEEEAKDAKNEQ